MELQRVGFCLLLAGVAAHGGCIEDRHRHDVVDYGDHVPPAEPRDVFTVTGDGQVVVHWSPPGDPDLAGYRVYISRDDHDYYVVAELPASQRHCVVRGDLLSSSVPFVFVNGTTYWFAVESRDWAGNRSELTDAAVGFDTPRPAGRDLRLYDLAGPRGAESGYDFSRSPYGYALDGSSLFADLYFTVAGAQPLLRSAHPLVVEIEDKGLLDFDDERVGWLYENEWSPSSQAVARLGHVYIVKIYEETRPGNAVEPFNVGKIQVVGLDSGSVLLDWAYQIAPNNRELKPGPAPVTHAVKIPRVEVQP